MKASRFTDAQKAFVVKQGEEGVPVSEICRKAGISDATCYNWKKKYSGMLPSEMKRLRELEDENNRLKRIVADLTLDREMLQDVIKRKLSGRLTSARLLIVFVQTGACRSGGLVRPFVSTARPISTSLVVAIRPF